MHVQMVFRYIILVVSGCAMVVGVLVMCGLLVPRSFPEQYGVLMGVVVFLYGAYRFAIEFFKRNQ